MPIVGCSEWRADGGGCWCKTGRKPKNTGARGLPSQCVCVCVSVFGDLQGNTLTQFMCTHKHRHTQYHPPTSLCYLLLSLTELSVCLKQSPHSQDTAIWSEPMTELRWGIMGNEVSGAAYLCANAVTKGYRCVFYVEAFLSEATYVTWKRNRHLGLIQDEKIQDHSFHFEEGHLGAILSLIFQAAGRAKRNKWISAISGPCAAYCWKLGS